MNEAEQIEGQLKELNDKYLYLYAEFENFKKRALAEKTQAVKFSYEPLAKDLLEVMDNLERSLKHLSQEPQTKETYSGLADGLKLILNQFKSVLEKHGIREIQTKDQPFDPYLHEAIGEAPSDQAQGSILKEERRGYQFQDRLLRPAQVIVSSGLQKKAV